MKPPPFSYHAPTTTDEALSVLAELGHDGKVLAGGQSLIPLLNMRLAAPKALVDINRIADLRAITVEDGAVMVGAGARHADLEHHEGAAAAAPLLRQALQLVAHPVIRNRGTVCGSIAHADPSGEMTAVLALLGGTVHVQHHDDAARDIAADEFFLAPLESCLSPGDLATAVTFPAMAAGSGSAFVEIARRHGDYALCGIGAVVEADADDIITRARIGAISINATPLVVDCSDPLAGRSLDEIAQTDEQHTEHRIGQAGVDGPLADAGGLVDEAAEPEADLHATVAYRRRLTRVLTGRALRAAAAHARSRRNDGGTA